jgi:hypothetical protein
VISYLSISTKTYLKNFIHDVIFFCHKLYEVSNILYVSSGNYRTIIVVHVGIYGDPILKEISL